MISLSSVPLAIGGAGASGGDGVASPASIVVVGGVVGGVVGKGIESAGGVVDVAVVVAVFGLVEEFDFCCCCIPFDEDEGMKMRGKLELLC